MKQHSLTYARLMLLGIASTVCLTPLSEPTLIEYVALPALVGNVDLSLEVVKTDQFVLRRSFLTKIKRLFKADTFVETGTYIGQTSLVASAVFNDVYTVELSSTLYEQCAQLFQKHSNIHLYQGESPLFLTTILPSLKGKVVFWLDAHDSAGITVRGTKETPIVEELQAIKESGIRNGVIIIDDLRQFYKDGSDFPTFTKLCQLIIAISPEYRIALMGDILVAFVRSSNVTVSPLIWACTLSRLHDENMDLPIDSRVIDRIIAQVDNDEAYALKWLTTFMYGQPDELANCSYKWWYGLVLLHRDNTSAQTLSLLQAALTCKTKVQRLALLGTDTLKRKAQENYSMSVAEMRTMSARQHDEAAGYRAI